MDSVNASIPLSFDYGPDSNQQLSSALTLANAFDARRSNLAGMQRAAQFRGIFQNPGAIDQNGNITPQALQQAWQYDPEQAGKLQAAQGMAAYHQLLGQGGLMRGQAAVQTANVKQADEAQKMQRASLSDMANLLYNNNQPWTESSYNNVKQNVANHIGTAEQHSQNPAMYWVDQNEFNQTFGQPYDPQKTPQFMNDEYNTFKAHSVGIAQQLGLDLKDRQTKVQEAAEKNKEYQTEATVDQGQQKINQQKANQNALLQIKAAQQRASAAKMNAALGGKLTDLDKQELGDVKTELTGRGTLGIQSKKIDAAIDTRAVMNRYFDPKTGQYNVPSSGYEELTTALSNLLSVSGGGSGGSEEQRRGLKQATAEGDLNRFLSYYTGAPKNATTQDMLKITADQIDAVGLQSEQNRNGYFPNIAKKYTDIGQDPQRALAIAQHAGNNYSDYLKSSYEQLGFPLDDRTQSQLYKVQTQGMKGAGKQAAGSVIKTQINPKTGKIEIIK
jgi:hypothetical protein